MTISKEERAELRGRLVQNLVCQTSKIVEALDAGDAEIARLKERNYHLTTRIDQADDGKRWALEQYEVSEHKLQKANARIAELEAAAQWRPIEEAPKDGRRVLVGNGRNSPVFARFIDRQWRSDERLGIVRPSHYLAIPALPEGGV